MPSKLSDENLIAALNALGPWHHQIQLRDEISTATERSIDATGDKPSLVNVARSFEQQVGQVFPDGLHGKSFLDCACNCGGYSFLAKDHGATRVLGFDVRDHWIDQAKFIAEHRDADSSGIEFRTADLLNIGGLQEKFDVTWFSGILYHLPDPVASLKLAADRTREIILVNTFCDWLAPGAVENPSLTYKKEGTQQLMSGVHEMSWLPSGPKVIKHMLNWMGFAETKTVGWNQAPEGQKDPARPNGRIYARVSVVASREVGRLEGVRNIGQPRETVPQFQRA